MCMLFWILKDNLTKVADHFGIVEPHQWTINDIY